MISVSSSGPHPVNDPIPVFVGGPCGGQHWRPDRPAPAGTIIVCGGANYRMNETGDLFWIGDAPVPGTGVGIPGVRNTERAWARFNRVLGHETRLALTRINRSNARIRRAGRK